MSDYPLMSTYLLNMILYSLSLSPAVFTQSELNKKSERLSAVHSIEIDGGGGVEGEDAKRKKQTDKLR